LVNWVFFIYIKILIFSQQCVELEFDPEFLVADDRLFFQDSGLRCKILFKVPWLFSSELLAISVFFLFLFSLTNMNDFQFFNFGFCQLRIWGNFIYLCRSLNIFLNWSAISIHGHVIHTMWSNLNCFRTISWAPPISYNQMAVFLLLPSLYHPSLIICS
jgi:hypothetical protein